MITVWACGGRGIGKLLAGLAMAFVLSGCGVRTDEPIVEVIVPDGGDGRTLHVTVDSCNSEPEIAVEESSQAVTLRATAASTGDDCADIVEVRLQEPLGDRSVVDGLDGELVSVQR